jgi:hypothetical protein
VRIAVMGLDGVGTVRVASLRVTCRRSRRLEPGSGGRTANGANAMSKGMDRKKEAKKKPAKTKEEKKAAKQEAKNSKRRGQSLV